MNRPGTVAADHGVWAYAVAETSRAVLPVDLRGVAGQPVFTVAAAGLAAAVGAVDLAEFGEEALRRNLEDLSWLESTAWAHHRVIDALARSSPVVPMRLATVFRRPEGVAAMLADRRYDLGAALALVEGRTEWGVKVYAEPQAAAAAPDTGPPGGPGAAYLRRRKAELSASEAAKRAAAGSAADLHTALSGLATAALVRPLQGPQLAGQAAQMIFNGAYLVDDERSADWSAAVQDLADRHPGIRLELTGPWPPYSFAAIEDQDPTEDQAHGASPDRAAPQDHAGDQAGAPAAHG
jgi:hypothetical protein